MKSNRFTSLTWAVPLIVCLLVVALSGPAFARYAYVAQARNNSGTYTAQFATVGFANSSGNHQTAAQSGWASSGAGPYSGFGIVGTGYQYTGANGACYSSGATPSKSATWTFNVPVALTNSGYYDVYEAHGTQPASDATPPTWTCTNAGANYVNTSLPPGPPTPGNTWNKLTSTPLQFNAGGSYTVTVATPVVVNWRQNVDSVAWVFVKSNAPTALTASIPPPPDEGTRVDLTWTAPSTAPASYQVERSDDGGVTFAAIATGVLTTSYQDTTGVCGPTYQYRVEGVVGTTVGGPSNTVAIQKCCLGTAPGQATTPISPLMDATIVHTDLSDTTTPGSVSWVAAGDAATQDVYFGTTNPPAFIRNQSVLAVTYAPGALLANKDYYWRIDERGCAGITTGDVWHFKTGVSLTVIPIRAANRGTLYDELSAVRAWSTTTWHNAGDLIGLSVTANTGYTWDWWTLNANGTRSTWANPPYPADSDLNQVFGQGDPYTELFHIPTTNTILYAVFHSTQVSLTIAKDPVADGTVVATNKDWPSALLTQFETGESAHLVATPPAGWVFAYWTSDMAGTFVDKWAATTDYAMTTDATTTITAHFSKAKTNLVDTAPLSIIASSAAGADDGSNNVQVNIGAYSTPTVFSRVVCNFENTIPATSMYSDLLGNLKVTHTTTSSYSSTVTLQVTPYPITTTWRDGQVVPGATWVYADRTVGAVVPWTTPGGDYGAALSPQLPMVGINEEVLNYPLATGSTDYRTLLAKGIELKGYLEGAIADWNGVGKDVTLNFFYDQPTGAGSGVITNWAYLGFYSQGVAADDALRLDTTDQVAGTYNGVPVTETTIAPKTGTSYGTTYGTYAWAVGSSATDLIDLLGVGFYNTAHANGVTYCATYVYNPGAAMTYYIGLGSDDWSKIWMNGVLRSYKHTASGVGYDQEFDGPFTLLSGWSRLVVKIENGTSAHGLYLRLANADRTPLTGIETLTFATTDATAPTNPTSVTPGGTWNNPTFLLAGAVDPEVGGQGVSGIRGFKVYFGTDPAGVPSTFQTSWTVTPTGPLAPGTYYLRVTTVDVALNESATPTSGPTFTYVAEEHSSHVVSYGLNGRAVHDAIISTASATQKFTVWGRVAWIDANSFYVDDGSGLAVKVIKTAHGLVGGEYVAARGTLNVSDPENPVLTAEAIEKYQ